MGRRRTHLRLSSAQQTELESLLATQRDPRIRERLKFVECVAGGRLTLEDVARKIGRSRSTIQNWLDKFSGGGLPGLLERDTPPGRESAVGRAGIQAQLRAGLASGRLKTATQVSEWLRETHGLKLARKSVYYWLKKRDESSPADPDPSRRSKR